MTDHLSTPRIVVDRTGSTTGISRHDYLPFGEELPSELRNGVAGYAVNDTIRQKFTSKERDIETGLDYFLARYYSSIQGGFTSPDEFTGGPVELSALGSGDSEKQALPYADITNPQSVNRYQYSFNNPLRYADPDGHDPQDPNPQNPSPGIVQRIIDSTNNIIGTLLRNFEKGRDTVPEEEPHRAPLSMGDKEMQTYIDAKGRAADQAREVLSYGDFTGVATTVHGVQTGNRKETVLGAIGMALNVAPALKPVSAALEKVGLKILTSKAGVMTAEGTASQAGKLFNLLRGGNKVQIVKPGVYTAKSAFGQGSVTFRIAAAVKSRMVSVDFKYIQPPLRKIHLIK